MAILDRGALLAHTYQLPQQQAIPIATPQAPQQYQDEIGDPMSDLEQVDGVTSEYFNKWAQLKGFAREVQSTMGIDVRYPDPSVPESERLHRIYLKALADLKGQGERLKTGQKMYMADRQRGAIIDGQGQQHYDELNVGTDIVDTKLDPIVAAANSKLNNYFYGGSIKEARSYYDQTKKDLEARRDNNPDQAGYWQRQIDSLVTPNQGVREFAPQRDSQANKSSIAAAGAHLKKVANMVEGTSKGYILSDKIFGPNGERVYTNKDMTGITYGGKPITEWRHTPSTGETLIVAGGQLIPLTGQDVVTIAKGIVTENPRFGIDGKYIDMYADEQGLFGDTEEVNPNALVEEDVVERVTSQRLAEEANADAEATEAALKTLKAEVSKLVPSEDKSVLESGWNAFRNDRFKGVTDNGKPVKINVRKADGKLVYDIENIADIIGRYDDKGKPRKFDAFKNLSKSDLIKHLSKMGVHFAFKESNIPENAVINESTPTSTTQTQSSGTNNAPTGETPGQKALREYRERQAKGN